VSQRLRGRHITNAHGLGNLSADAFTHAASSSDRVSGERYVPEKTERLYHSKAGEQEAHEAIRPTDVRVDARRTQGRPDEQRLDDSSGARSSPPECRQPSTTPPPSPSPTPTTS